MAIIDKQLTERLNKSFRQDFIPKVHTFILCWKYYNQYEPDNPFALLPYEIIRMISEFILTPPYMPYLPKYNLDNFPKYVPNSDYSQNFEKNNWKNYHWQSFKNP